MPDDLVTRCQAAALVLPPAAVFTGRTGAALLGLPWALGAADVLEEPLAVAVPKGPVPDLRGVDAARSRWAVRAIRPHSGLSVLEPAQLWCEVGARLELVDHVALADAVRRWWEPQPRMEAAVRRRARERGAPRLREVLALMRYPVDSAMETRLRLLLVRSGLPEPEVGWEVEDGTGGHLPPVDMAWPAARTALEHDGDQHRTDQKQWRRDASKRRALRTLGWEVLQATAEDVTRPDRLLSDVTTALRARGATP